MNRFFYPYHTKYLGIIILIFYSLLFANSQNCSICLKPLGSVFSIDAWGNAFHTKHENDGIFCHSCSRIISQGVTQGGYIYPDGRHLCSLCTTTAINNDSSVNIAYQSVLLQFKKVGIPKITTNISIKLLNIHQLNQKVGNILHTKLKGFTKTTTNIQFETNFEILILSGLPKIEFEAILAHELLHVFIHQYNIVLSIDKEEGFCNLGRYLIYNNDNTKFSKIHLHAMEQDTNPIYGIGYHKLKSKLIQSGWENLILDLMN